MSVAPHAGVVDFGTFTPPTPSLDGIQGEVPQPLIGQENYVLTGNGWSSLAALGALTYQGTWDASTNTPTLVSSVGVQGYYYVVSVAGNTNLNGTTTWDVGDWAIFNGSAWQKIEGGTVGTFTNVITPQVTARTDNLTLSAISTGAVKLNTLGGLQFQINDRPSADVYVAARGGVGAVTRSSIGAAGTGASGFNIYNSQGQAIRFQTNGEGNSEQFAITHTGTSVNYVQVTGAATGGSPTISGQGSDADINFNLASKGSGAVRIQTSGIIRATVDSGGATNLGISASGGVALKVPATGSQVNYFQMVGSATTTTPVISTLGSDTNIALALKTQGTGAIDLAAGSSGVNISNGGTVTAITRVTGGTLYTASPTITITPPTTAGGVTATATCTLGLISSSTIGSGGTGYTVGDVLTLVGGTFTVVSQITVATVSSGVITGFTVSAAGTYTAAPSNPASLSGGTGSGATLNTNFTVNSTFTITNAGSGYIEQPSITFSSGGAAAYAQVGSSAKITGLSNVLSFYTPNGEAFRVQDSGTTSSAYWVAYGTSGGAILRATSTTSAAIQSASAVPIQFVTNTSAEQLRVAHTASAVNYIQAQGSATGNATGPIISMQGSDANISTQIQGKGTGSVNVLTPTALGGTTGNTAELFAAKGFNTNAIWLRASQFRNSTGTDWTTASLRLGMRIDATDMSFIEFSPSGFAQGLAFQTANSQPINFKTSGGEQLRVANVSSAVNYHGQSGSSTGNALQYFAAGSDTNISMAIQPKGTGAINLATVSGGINISNSGTVTNITRTNQGSGYTTLTGLTWSASAPTTVGGVTATGTVTSLGGVSVSSIASGGTGYTVGNVLTVVGGTFSSATSIRVDTVSSGVITAATLTNGGTYTVIPSNPASVTGGSGTGATFNISYGILGLAIGTAGSGYIEQPTITFSGGGGSGAAAYATVGSGTIVKALGNNINFNTPNSQVLSIVDKNSGGNYPTNTNPAFTMVPSQNAFGASYLGMLTSGYFATNNTSASAYVFATGITPPLNGNGGSAQLQIGHTASAVNYLQTTGGATTKLPILSALGSDTNVSLGIQSKGTGAIDLAAGSSGVNISNGGTVTGVITATRGNGYTALPSVAISAPITTGGVQATATALLNLNSLTLVSGGTGYTALDVLTVSGVTGGVVTLRVDTVAAGVISTFTVTNFGSGTVSAIPANPVSVTGGTGTGATFTANWNCGNITVGTAGSGYVEQPTVTITGGVSNGTAYATVGSGTIVRSIGSTMSIHTPGGEQVRFGDTFVLGTSANYWTLQGRAAGAQPAFGVAGSDTNISAQYNTKGTGQHIFYTNGGAQLQLAIAHTASAVNYVQVTGATTTNRPRISFEGSDGNIGGLYVAKGTSGHSFCSDSNASVVQFAISRTASAVNYLQATGSAAGSAPSFSAIGTDTDIDLALTPKGTGRVKYGTYTGTILTPTGYIEIVDSGGTVRRLLVG